MELVKPRVQQHELGIFLKTIEIDFKPTTNSERAELISKYFPVYCEVSDIELYELNEAKFNELLQEDYELLSRRENYFQSIGNINPFL